MLNEYTIHYEVLDYDGDQVWAAAHLVYGMDRKEARRKFKTQLTLNEGQSLHIWDIVQNNL
jgi:hypothetical protein